MTVWLLWEMWEQKPEHPMRERLLGVFVSVHGARAEMRRQSEHRGMPRAEWDDDQMSVRTWTEDGNSDRYYWIEELEVVE